jgi:hypothetical protein
MAGEWTKERTALLRRLAGAYPPGDLPQLAAEAAVEIERLQNEARGWEYGWQLATARAEQAEARLARVGALAKEWRVLPWPRSWRRAANAVEAALSDEGDE